MLSILVSFVGAAYANPEIMNYEDWKEMFHPTRVFTLAEHELNDDEAHRRSVFEMNLEKIRKQNARNDAGESGYRFGVNQFADLTEDEFQIVAGLGHPIPTKTPEERNEVFLPVDDTTKSIDWRTQNAVTAVKNQGQCGSCWSFSSTGAIEGAVAVATGQLTPLSEKQLMDCSKSYGNNSCNGGLMDYAFQYVIANGGITSESNYPYVASDGTCNKIKEKQVVAGISGFQDVPHDNVDQMIAAVSGQPVSVAIEADKSAFQLYSGGVLDSYGCGTNLDHGVLVVGFTDVDDDQTYPNAWIVKNSWGATWGVQGYIYVSREVRTTPKGICGILESASYATGGSTPSPGPGPGPTPTPAPGSGYYENPFTGSCNSNEFTLTLSEVNTVQGKICAPGCGRDHTDVCPNAPNGVTAVPTCMLKSNMLDMQFCGLKCSQWDTSKSCGPDMDCVVTCDTGTNQCDYACVYRDPNEKEAKKITRAGQKVRPVESL